MVQKIVGLDAKGNKVFERDARAYDKGLANTVFGITLGDVFKVIPILILVVSVHVNQQNFNTKILSISSDNAQAIGGLKDVVINLNNYLSSQTGKQFKDGRPL